MEIDVCDKDKIVTDSAVVAPSRYPAAYINTESV